MKYCAFSCWYFQSTWCDLNLCCSTNSPSSLFCFIYYTALQCPIVSKVPHSAGWKCERDSKAQNGDFPYKTECRNQCKPGYLPKPGTSQFIICGLDLARTNGKWSGNALVCERKLNCCCVQDKEYIKVCQTYQCQVRGTCFVILQNDFLDIVPFCVQCHHCYHIFVSRTTNTRNSNSKLM